MSQDEVELMEYLDGPQAASEVEMTHLELYKAPGEVELELRLEWSEKDFPDDFKKELQSRLQSWCNKNVKKSGCTIVSAEGDRAVVKIASAAAIPTGTVDQLAGESLTKDKKTIKVLSVTSANGAVVLPPSLGPRKQDQEHSERGSSSSLAADSPTEGIPYIPLSRYWCLRHIYNKEIEQIQIMYGVKIKEEVKVHFEAQQSDGDPQQAAFEFTALEQSFRQKIKDLNPEGWSNTLKIIQDSDNKILCSLLAEEMSIWGPEHARLAVSQSLKTTQSTGGSPQTSEDMTLKNGVGARDPLSDAELTMTEGHWRELTTHDRFAKIKRKFGVNFKEMANGPGNVAVKAHYEGVRGNALLESHAIRALLRLLQRVVTSPRKDLVKHLNGDKWSDVTSGASSVQHASESGMDDTEAPAGGGAKAGDDDRCSICLESYTNKTRLKCSHEFCGSCLERAKENSGPICPICRVIFGVVEGNQPDGIMSWRRVPISLQGFPQCGMIVISYSIPSGIQTEKHPRPGQPYHGTCREAYLPDNKEGNEVLSLLRRAFDQKLIFTIGMSRTTGRDNQVTWNDIHHKTSTTGGPAGFGYPDPDYLRRVREELKQNGIE